MDLSNSIHLISASNALFGEAEEMIMNSDSAAITMCQSIKDLLVRNQSLEDIKNALELELVQKDGKMSEMNKELSVAEAQLRGARAQVGVLHKENKELESKIEKLLGAVNLLREATSGELCPDALAILSDTDLQPRRITRNRDSEVLEDSIFDKTGESNDDILPYSQPCRVTGMPNGAKKRSISAQPVHSQKRFAYAEDIRRESTTTGVTQNLSCIKENINDVTPNYRIRDIIPTDTTPIYPISKNKLRRSISETIVYSSKQKSTLLTKDGCGDSIMDAKSLASLDLATTEKAWASDFYSIATKQHTFSKKGSTMTYCDCCKGFVIRSKAVVKCEDCGSICHNDCKDDLPRPCVPVPERHPFKSGSKPKLLLSDFCSNRFPMIPYIVVHCVATLEKFHLTNEGLYRVPGSASDVSRLYNAFLYNRGIPSLIDVDPETITSCLKKFLSELKTPIIPQSSRTEFISAVQRKDTNALRYAISDLPAPNLHTLAYLCLHWQKVAESSQQNKMPIENIANVIGPTVVGYSKSPSLLTQAQSEREMESQCHVMLELLQQPECYWMQFLVKKTADITGGSKTPISAMNTLKRNQLYHKTMCSLNQNNPFIPYEPDATVDTTHGRLNNTVLSSVVYTPPQGNNGVNHLSPRTLKRDLIKRDYVNKKYY